jgi:hypothetical protein
MPFTFQTARREKLKARVAIDGPSGAGKTWDMLQCLTALAGPNGKIAVIDTERGSARIYADFFKFDVLELPMDHRGYSPAVYVEAIHAAEDAGYTAIGIDSMSHAWEGVGGALELVDQAVAKSKSGNSYVAWRSVTPLHTKMIDAMLQSPAHIVVTMRSKMDYEQKDGKVTKLGLAPIQRQGMEYEFTFVCDVNVDHLLIVSKSRYADFADRQVMKPDLKFFQELADWLAGGAEPEPRPLPTTEAPKAEIDPSWTLPNLMAVTMKAYGRTEPECRAALKAAGFTKFTPEMYIGAKTALDMAFAQAPAPEEEPGFLKAEA